MITSTLTTDPSAALGAFAGNRLAPSVVLTLTHIYATIELVAGAEYKGNLYRMNGNDIAEILAIGPTIVAPTTETNNLVWKLANPVVLLPGNFYLIAANRIDATPSTDLNLRASSLEMAGFPGYPLLGVWSGNFISPPVGTTLNPALTAEPRSVNCVYEF